jgi:thiamine-monophosphate kinase
MPERTVADVGEFGVIAALRARLPPGPATVLGPGDDAAVLLAPDGRVVATTDVLVDGLHFRRDWSSAADVGSRAAAANLADVLAMGAAPTALLVGLATPADLPLAWVEGLADGLRDEAALVGAAVAGGDTVRSPTLMVSVTALGDLGGRDPVTRSGARPGDDVVVVGRLGWAAAGLALLESGDPELLARHPDVVAAHRRPRLAAHGALSLAAAGATAMLDVSDGLAADLGHLAVASAVTVEVSTADLPVAPEVAAAAADLGADPVDWVAGGGDDHAFVAALPPGAWLQVLAALGDAPQGYPLVQVGRVLAGPGEVVWLDGAGPRVTGHDHFGEGPGA